MYAHGQKAGYQNLSHKLSMPYLDAVLFSSLIVANPEFSLTTPSSNSPSVFHNSVFQLFFRSQSHNPSEAAVQNRNDSEPQEANAFFAI